MLEPVPLRRLLLIVFTTFRLEVVAMRRWILAAVSLLLLLGPAPLARANWFCGPMDPYPGYGHPSFYFPAALGDWYANSGYASLMPGISYYTPTEFAHGHPSFYPAAPVTGPATGYPHDYAPGPGFDGAMPWSGHMGPYAVQVPDFVQP
jgi:hypothetical protein